MSSGMRGGASRKATDGPFDDQHALSGAYALDALSELERRQFEHHLSQCELCTADVAEFQATAARLADAVEFTPPPAALRETVLALAHQTPQERETSPVSAAIRPTLSSSVRWLSIAAAALLVVAGGLGVVAYNNSQEVDQLTASAAAVAAVINADDAEVVKGSVEGGGTGSLVVSRERGEAVIVATDLNPPPPGSAYQLWAINDSGARSRGLLDLGPDNAAGQVIPWPSDAATFGMTVEPAGGSEQPTTDPILLLDVPV